MRIGDRIGLAVLLCLAAAALAGCREEAVQQLPALAAQRDQTSVSGISSGAYMAGQFQMAHGGDVVGAGIIAGGPYGCAESLFADVMPGPGSAFLNMSRAINGCMLDGMRMWGVPDAQLLADRARGMAERGDIAPINTIASDRIYLFTGREDRTVVASIVRAAGEFYALLGVDRSAMKLVDEKGAGHAIVTDDSGAACEKSGKPYIVDCDYDQAGDLLAHIHGALKPRVDAPGGSFLVYDQRPFTRDLGEHGMADFGVVYVPPACQSSARCRVHIAFHGCAQSREAVSEDFVKMSGYARWADNNDLVVLFPQTTTGPLNPQGCWDWWGYTGRDYLNRNAPQIVAVYRMLEQLSRPRAGS
jgi:hypothetical protein